MAKEFRLVLVLTVICVVSAAVLGWVNALTAPAIQLQQEMAKQKALQEALATATEFQPETAFQKEGELSDLAGIVEVYRGYRGSHPEGLVFIVEQQGYADVIRMAVGVTMEGNLAGLNVISQAETPGLGAKIKDGEFLSQPAFRNATVQDQLAVTKDKGEVEAITSATISSRAVVNGVNLALVAGRSLLEAENEIGGAQD